MHLSGCVLSKPGSAASAVSESTGSTSVHWCHELAKDVREDTLKCEPSCGAWQEQELASLRLFGMQERVLRDQDGTTTCITWTLYATVGSSHRESTRTTHLSLLPRPPQRTYGLYSISGPRRRLRGLPVKYTTDIARKRGLRAVSSIRPSQYPTPTP